jgi:hypothetical protein
LVEHATENRSVGGSIPPLGTIPQFNRNVTPRKALRRKWGSMLDPSLARV